MDRIVPFPNRVRGTIFPAFSGWITCGLSAVASGEGTGDCVGVGSVVGIDLVGNGVVVGAIRDGCAVGEPVTGCASPQLATTTSAISTKNKLRPERFLNLENFPFADLTLSIN